MFTLNALYSRDFMGDDVAMLDNLILKRKRCSMSALDALFDNMDVCRMLSFGNIKRRYRCSSGHGSTPGIYVLQAMAAQHATSHTEGVSRPKVQDA